MARLDARWNNFSERGQAWDHFWQDAASGGPTPVTYEFTGAVALTFGVSSPLAVTYAEPVAVALTFGVASANQFVPSGNEPEISGTRMTLRWKPKPVTYEFEGLVTLHLGVRSQLSVSHVPRVGITQKRATPRSSRQFINVPPPQVPLSESDQLVLAGV